MLIYLLYCKLPHLLYAMIVEAAILLANLLTISNYTVTCFTYYSYFTSLYVITVEAALQLANLLTISN